MIEVTVQEAQKHLKELIDRVIGGEEVLISLDNQQTQVRLTTSTGKADEVERQTGSVRDSHVHLAVPVAGFLEGEDVSARQPGSAKGLIQMADDFDEPLEDFREYM